MTVTKMLVWSISQPSERRALQENYFFFFFPKKYLFSQEKLRLASSILEYLKPAPNTIFFQHIENPLKLCDILLKCEISLILVEYLL